MGAAHVTVAVSNAADPERRWEGLFLVDAGAIDCYVPASKLREIGVGVGRYRSRSAESASQAAAHGAIEVKVLGQPQCPT